MKNVATKPYTPADNLPADRTQPRAKAKGAGRARLRTLDRLDQRTLAAKRVNLMIASMSKELIGDSNRQLTIAERELVQRAAMLGAILESNETAWLEGDDVDLVSHFAALNNQRRLLQTLNGLERSRATESEPA